LGMNIGENDDGRILITSLDFVLGPIKSWS
jgi:hypothetical protein